MFSGIFRFTRLAFAVLALLIIATGCRKTEPKVVRVGSFNYGSPVYMKSTDAAELSFEVESEGTLDVANAIITGGHPSISSSYTIKEIDGETFVILTVNTTNTPDGAYKCRLAVVNADGNFSERVFTVEVVNFLTLLMKAPTNPYYVEDTLAYKPFSAGNLIEEHEYQTRVSHKAGDPANRVIFSDLGNYWQSIGSFENVMVDVDSVTGVFTAPPQWVGTGGFSGHGQLSIPANNYRVRGYFEYTYKTTSGYDIDGHLSFY